MVKDAPKSCLEFASLFIKDPKCQESQWKAADPKEALTNKFLTILLETRVKRVFI